MAESAQAREVSVKLSARDETAHAYESAKKRLEEYVHHSNANVKLLKHTAEGAGVGIAAELLGHVFEGAGEGLDEFTEKLAHAKNEAQETEAAFGLLKQVPIFGELYGGMEHLTNAVRDYHAEWLRGKGVDEATVDSFRSVDGYMKVVHERLMDVTAAYREQRQALNELTAAKTSNTATPETSEAGAAARASLDKIADAKIELQKYVDEHPKALRDEASTEATVIKQKIETIRNMEEAARLEVQNIHDKYARQSAEDGSRSYRDDERAEFEHGQKLLDLKTAAQAAELRFQKRDGEAALIEMHRRHEQELAESKRAEDERIRAIQDAANQAVAGGSTVNFQDVKARQQEERAAGERERAAAAQRQAGEIAVQTQTNANQLLDEQEQRRHTYASLRLQILKEEAAMGNQQAQQAAQLLGLQEKFNSRREELNRLLREAHDMPDSERKKIQSALIGLDQLQEGEKKAMQMGVIGPPTSPFASSGELAAGATGAREAYAAGVQSREDQQIELQRSIVDKLTGASQTLIDLLAAVAPISNQFNSGGFSSAGL